MVGGFSFGSSHSPDIVARLKASGAKDEAKAAKREAEYLKHDIDRLYMITEALWQMLKENCNIDDDELLKRVMKIDMKDGRLDGRTAPGPPRKCTKCGRTMSKKNISCIYCGTPVKMDPFSR